MLDSAPEQNEPQVWAHKGEAVTCINGHAICHIARTLYVGDPRSGADFENWMQPEPDRTTQVTEIRCKTCRGTWVRGSRAGGYQFHFGDDKNGGWR